MIEFVINRDLLALLREENVDGARLQKIVDQVTRWNFEIDKTALNYVATKKVNRLMEKLSQNPQDISLLKSMELLLRVLMALPLDLNLWRAQNMYFAMSPSFSKNGTVKSMPASPDNEQRIALFQALGNLLQVQHE